MVNHKKLRRLMRENDLSQKQRRRYVVTTNSDHAGPIFPDLAKGVVPDRPNQLWVADLTYVAIPGGFVYLAAILDAWSRMVVGYAISRSMDARIAVAALKAAIRSRNPPKAASTIPTEARWPCPAFVDGRVFGNLGRMMQLHSHPVLLMCKHSLVRPPAEPFFRPDPHPGAAAARSTGQGSPKATAVGGAKRP